MLLLPPHSSSQIHTHHCVLYQVVTWPERTTTFCWASSISPTNRSLVFLPLDGSTPRSRGVSLNSKNQHFDILLPGSWNNLQKTLQLSEVICLGEFKTLFALRRRAAAFFGFFERHLSPVFRCYVMCYCNSVLAGSPYKKRFNV